MKDWIDVNDMLPEKHKKLLFLDDSVKYPDNAYTGVYYGNNTWHRSGSFTPQSNITHWMYIPENPFKL